MKLKVYGWLFHRAEAKNNSQQTREICAATSMREVGRITGQKVSNLFNLCETGNDEELRVALAEPGIIFWRELDSRGEWKK